MLLVKTIDRLPHHKRVYLKKNRYIDSINFMDFASRRNCLKN